MKRIIGLSLIFGLIVGCGGEEIAQEEVFRREEWSAPGFQTDFSRLLVDPAEIVSGGPPKDGIPAVDRPRYTSIESAETWLDDREPVILVRIGEHARIYPLQILTWHEIVNDVLGGEAIAVTYCPLCSTGVVYRREIDGKTLDFGTTGRLRFSNLIMYDRQTESWWQQATGAAIIGEMAMSRLTIHPSLTLSFGESKATEPNAEVLSRDTGFSRPYGSNPYVNYDNPGNRPFLYSGDVDPKFDAMARVIVLHHAGDERIVSYEEVRELGILEIELGGEAIILFWSPGTSSALDDAQISLGREVGSLNAFLSDIEGETTSFENLGEGTFRDDKTGSIWDSSGRAIEGPLEGERLVPVVGVQHFWFSAMAFSTGSE